MCKECLLENNDVDDLLEQYKKQKREIYINGYETDHSGAPYDAGDALDFIFKWYGTCTRHTITRP